MAGCEHYAEGVRTTKRMCKSQREAIKLRRQLRVENEIFRNALELLLNGCVEEELLNGLVNDPMRNPWSKDLEGPLRRKLRRSYDVFDETVTSLGESFRELLDLLGLESEREVRSCVPCINMSKRFSISEWSLGSWQLTSISGSIYQPEVIQGSAKTLSIWPEEVPPRRAYD
jgi:hypothetical protein